MPDLACCRLVPSDKMCSEVPGDFAGAVLLSEMLLGESRLAKGRFCLKLVAKLSQISERKD